MRSAPGPRDDKDRGTIAPVLPILAILILLLGGLIVDGARQLNARAQVIAYAEEAARAGAGAIDLTSSELSLIPEDARGRVENYCSGIMRNAESGVRTCEFVGIETPGGDDPRQIVVHVRVTAQIPPTLLAIIGVGDLHVTGEGRARPFEGILRPDDIRSGTGNP